MSYTPPDLSQVLTNEQTMNSRLTTCRNDLRAILAKEQEKVLRLKNDAMQIVERMHKELEELAAGFKK